MSWPEFWTLCIRLLILASVASASFALIRASVWPDRERQAQQRGEQLSRLREERAALRAERRAYRTERRETVNDRNDRIVYQGGMAEQPVEIDRDRFPERKDS